MHRLGYVLGVVLMLAAFAAAIIALWKLATGLNAQLILALVTLAGTTGVAIWTFQKTKEKEADARQFSEKAAVYKTILYAVKDLMAGRTTAENPDFIAILSEAKYNLIIWASIDTIRAMDSIGSSDEHPGDVFARAAFLMGCMRRDLGHKVTADDCVDLMASLIRADEKHLIYTNTPASPYYKNTVLKTFKPRRG